MRPRTLSERGGAQLTTYRAFPHAGIHRAACGVRLEGAPPEKTRALRQENPGAPPAPLAPPSSGEKLEFLMRIALDASFASLIALN